MATFTLIALILIGSSILAPFCFLLSKWIVLTWPPSDGAGPERNALTDRELLRQEIEKMTGASGDDSKKTRGTKGTKGTKGKKQPPA